MAKGNGGSTMLLDQSMLDGSNQNPVRVSIEGDDVVIRYKNGGRTGSNTSGGKPFVAKLHGPMPNGDTIGLNVYRKS